MNIHLPGVEETEAVHRLLLDWYAVSGRDLPWRHTDDPYKVLVSEIMLQQTQVDRVIPKYDEFTGAFPTIYTLADASASDVIRVWRGLGYNTRAVRLQRIAQQVVSVYSGQIPSDFNELLKLKGIGIYTAGAIACFAFHQDIATVDTNIRRVLQRIFIGIDATSALTEKEVWQLASHVVPHGYGYDWNQALMDIGATICLSQSPKCFSCPMKERCRTYKSLSVYELFPSGESIRVLLRVAEPKARYKVNKPFNTTDRYYRGKIIDILSSHKNSGRTYSIASIGEMIKSDFELERDIDWLKDLVLKLEKDGLVAINKQELINKDTVISLP